MQEAEPTQKFHSLWEQATRSLRSGLRAGPIARSICETNPTTQCHTHPALIHLHGLRDYCRSCRHSQERHSNASAITRPDRTAVDVISSIRNVARELMVEELNLETAVRRDKSRLHTHVTQRLPFSFDNLLSC